MPDYMTISITGYQGNPVPNTFIKQDETADHLALVLPGYGYRATMPVLYYPSLVLQMRGADVLMVEYDYRAEPEFGRVSPEERERWMWEDVSAALQAGLRERDYGRLTLVGKSIGTLAMGQLVTSSDELAASDCIWLTPLVRQESLRAQIAQAAPRSLFVIGDADPQYDQAGLQEVMEATGGRSVVIEGADHSLEVAGDAVATVEAMHRAVVAVEEFLG